MSVEIMQNPNTGVLYCVTCKKSLKSLQKHLEEIHGWERIDGSTRDTV